MALPPQQLDLWLRIATATAPLAPALFSYALPPLSLEGQWTYTPRGLLYSHELAPLFLAPWAVPESLSSIVSRFGQCAVMFFLLSTATLYMYPFWIALALTRGLIGFLLTRSVGWAFPPLFSHWALYEPASGFGPSVLAYLSLFGTEKLTDLLPTTVKVRNVDNYILPFICASFCWLEHAPWTYGIAILCIAIIHIARMAVPGLSKREDYATLPSSSNGDTRPYAASTHHRSFFKSLALSFLSILLPYILFILLPSPPRLPLPPSPNSSTPLLDILILSYPRPDPNTSAQILSTTLSSYIPHLSPDTVTLSAFTHSTIHPAFEQVQKLYANRVEEGTMSFFVDADSHPEAVDGQYLHLAEAMRWVLQKGAAEWVMLVEDDFPVCGEDGWRVVETVMNMLEMSRLEGDVRAGFVGTGGSGIIVHRTYLRLLILLLRTYASTDSNSPLPPTVSRRPPDVVMQDCILGRPGSLCAQPPGKGRLVIPSRLVLDHIGGMATTTRGKLRNSDKWRCGWRHPFHGEDAVEVVVV